MSVSGVPNPKYYPETPRYLGVPNPKATPETTVRVSGVPNPTDYGESLECPTPETTLTSHGRFVE